MIRFKQYLEESRSAPLYHATHTSNLESIMKNGFKAETMQLIYQGNRSARLAQYGVSFARTMRASDDYVMRDLNLNKNHYVVIEVDQIKINQRYKIVPFDYFNHLPYNLADKNLPNLRRSEAEEFVIIKRTWDDQKNDFVGSLEPNVIRAIHYYPSSFNTSFINILMARYPHIQWKMRK